MQHIRLVGSILHYVEQNLSEPLSLQDIAEKYNYSITYISKLFKSVTGSSLVSYIIEKRIARARQLMYEDLEIMEIAERVGYHNYSNFYKAFKKSTGSSPEEYRRQWPPLPPAPAQAFVSDLKSLPPDRAWPFRRDRVMFDMSGRPPTYFQLIKGAVFHGC